MTTIIPRRSMVGDYGHAKRGVPIEVDDETAKQLVASGLAMLPGGAVAKAEKPDAKANADKGPTAKGQTKAGRRRAENPTPPLPPGGQTGEVQQSSVSPEGQAQDPQTLASSSDQAQS